jgi:hypothetical protein
MTIEADIFTALKGLVSNRCFPDFAPLGTVRPFITFEQTGGEALSFLDNSLPDKKHGRFEIGVYADTRASCAAIALQVEAAMAAATAFQSTAIHAPISDYASDVKIYSSTQNFSVFSTR